MLPRLKRVLLNSEYEIVLTERMSGCGRGRSGPHLYGMILPDQHKILIKRSISLAERTRTLIHELLHAVYPTWCEDLVEQTTLKMYSYMSDRDKGFFMFFVQSPADRMLHFR